MVFLSRIIVEVSLVYFKKLLILRIFQIVCVFEQILREDLVSRFANLPGMNLIIILIDCSFYKVGSIIMNRKSISLFLIGLCFIIPIMVNLPYSRQLSNPRLITRDQDISNSVLGKCSARDEYNASTSATNANLDTNSVDEIVLEHDLNGNKIDDRLESFVDTAAYSLGTQNNSFIPEVDSLRVLFFVNKSRMDGIMKTIKENALEIHSATEMPNDMTAISATLQNSKIESIIRLFDTHRDHAAIKLEEEIEPLMNQALLQGRIYPTIREDYDLYGDNESTIAIIDSGVDETHPMLEGYGDKDFTKKIVGWEDFTDEKKPDPYERTEHGTFVSSVAAGFPYNSTDGMGRTVFSSAVHREWSVEKGPLFLDTVCSFNVTAPGLITVNGSWRKGTVDSRAEVHNITILSPDGEYVANEAISDENINTIVEYDAAVDELGVYKVGYFFNISGDIFKTFDLFTDIHYNVSTETEPKSIQGVAPEARLVVLKVRYESDYIEAMQWLLDNGTDYNVTTVNMSFRIASTSVASLVEDLVESGFVCVAAAGNEYGENNWAGGLTNIPGSVDKVLSVGAIDNRNHISSYSSGGGPSWQDGIMKPDCVAPGGEFSTRTDDYLPLIAADSNDKDYLPTDPEYPDRISDDLDHRAGTSFSCAYVSGATQLIIEALGGHKNWNYTEEESLALKSWLLMTATETAPNTRNYPGSYDPSLDRGGKDRHEGYGRVNPDAVIEMLGTTIPMNTSISKKLVATAHESNYYGKTCYAGTVQMKKTHYYDFNLTVPETGDFDVYIYDDAPDAYGQPQLVASSTIAGQGQDEIFRFAPESDGKYYITVKAIRGSGLFYFNITDRIDTNKPNSLQVYTPSVNSFYHGSLLFSVLFEDQETAVENISIHFDQLDNESHSNIVKKYDPVTIDYTDEFYINSEVFNDGYYNITCTAADRNNNARNASKIFVCIDNTQPTNLLITSPLENSKHYGEMEISGTASDGLSGLDYVQFFLFTREQPICTIADPTSIEEFRCSVDTVESDDGFNYVWIKAYDRAGNSDSSSLFQIEVINRNINRIATVILISFMGLSSIAVYKTAENVLVNIDLEVIFNLPYILRKLVYTITGSDSDERKTEPEWRRIKIDKD